MSEPSLIATLEAALRAAAPEKRSAVLDHVADLFIAGADRYSDTQIALFDAVLLKLARDIEVKARRKLARRLAPLPRAPKDTMRHLAHDQYATVAAPVIAHWERLADSDLMVLATSGSDAHRYALSRRRGLNEAVAAVLADFGGRRVARALAGNADAQLSDATFARLVQRAAHDDLLAQAVGKRRDIPRHRFAELLLTASSSVRVKLAADAPFSGREVEEAVAEAMVTIGRATRVVSQDLELAKAEVLRLCRSGRSGDVDTHKAARARKFDQTATALSRVCRVPFDVAERALTEEKPDQLLILAKAAGCSWKTTKGLLCVRSGDRPLPPEDLQQARSDFERLQRATATQVLEHYRAGQRRSA